MSTATVPFVFRRGFFPFCASQVASAPSSVYDFVDLTAVAGDVGFADAHRLHWLLESFTISPVGTLESIISPGTFYSFTKNHTAPGPDTADLVDFSVGGSIVGRDGVTDTSIAFVEPAARACATANVGEVARVVTGYQFTAALGTTQTEVMDFRSSLVFISGVWRLYYRFTVDLRLSGTVMARFQNPALLTPPSGTSVVQTGSFTFNGLTIPYEFALRTGSYTATGVSISSSEQFLTF